MKNIESEEFQIKLSERIINDIVNSMRQYSKGVSHLDPYIALERDRKNCKASYIYLKPLLERHFHDRKPKILEIGSGCGFQLCYLISKNLNVTGIEPGNRKPYMGRYEQALEILRINGIESPEKYIKKACAEDLPFSDNSFDIVYGIAILEHVRDVRKAVEEAARVAKPNGIVFVNVPNYNSFQEGHYHIFWLPYMNKCLARKYVKFLFRRDPNFLDELTFTTPKYFKQLAFLKEKGIMQTYFTFRHPFNKVSALYFYLSRGWHPKTSRFSLFFSNAVLSNILLCLSKCITNALGYLGFAFVFELYFKKNGPMVR